MIHLRTAKRVSADRALAQWWHLEKHVTCRISLNPVTQPTRHALISSSLYRRENAGRRRLGPVMSSRLHPVNGKAGRRHQASLHTLRLVTGTLCSPGGLGASDGAATRSKARAASGCVREGRERRGAGRRRSSQAGGRTAFSRTAWCGAEKGAHGGPGGGPASRGNSLLLLRILRARRVSFPGLSRGPKQLCPFYRI